MFELHSDTIQAGDQATTLSATDIAAICADLDANAHFVGNFESAIAELPNMPQGNDRDRQARLLLSAQTEVATIVIANAQIKALIPGQCATTTPTDN